LHIETVIKGNNTLNFSYQTAALVMDNIPLLVRLLRAKFREKRVGELTMAQFRTLAFVDANQGASLSEVAGQIGLGLPSMSKLVDTLVSRTLLTRSEHGQDRRRICLALTGDGKRELDEAYRHTQSFFAEKFAELTEDERAQVSGAMNVLKKLFALDSQAAVPEAPAGEEFPIYS
jgi:DNA-binding MarR family transcriptional regulator